MLNQRFSACFVSCLRHKKKPRFDKKSRDFLIFSKNLLTISIYIDIIKTVKESTAKEGGTKDDRAEDQRA